MSEKTYQAAVCNICGGRRYRQVKYFKEITQGRKAVKDVAIIQCLDCKVRRRMPEIIDDYEEEYHGVYVEQGLAIHPHTLKHFAQLMTARLRVLNAKNLSFLDVGCSTGMALRLAKTMGFEPTGLDYSKWAADYCTKIGFATRQGSLLGQWQEGEQFDIIHFSHVIEHLPDPVAYLKEMHRLLKRGGYLMLACPNFASLSRLLEGKKWIWCLDSHLWQFTAKQIRNILVQQGFTIVSLETHHGLTPNNQWKRRALDLSALLGHADALCIIATKL